MESARRGSWVTWVSLGVAITALIVAVSAISLDEVAGAGSSPSAMERSVSTGEGEVDLFAPPEDLKALLEKVQKSTVVIECKRSQGSGWVIDLGSPDPDSDPDSIEVDRRYPYEVITNDHVIEDCHDSPRKVKATADGVTYDAVLYSYDVENDLALVAIKQVVPALDLSDKPEPGWWAAAVGTPYGYEGSVSIGNIMNTDGREVYATTPLNSGNSGGPLINARGEVIGTNTSVLIGDGEPQDWNIAMAHFALCEQLVVCEGPKGWNWAD